MLIKRSLVAALAATALAASLAACGGDGGSSSGTGDGEGAGEAGGTLQYLTFRPVEHLDPQRTYIGRDLANLSRLAYRSLVSFPVTDDESKALEPVPDMATDLGTSTKGGKVWSYTLKDGIKWEDGKDVTCEDLKYGVSRSFATDIITGGPNYILGYLDVPLDRKTGLPEYNGPYKGDNQADFDKAVTCDGNTITYRFNKPWANFPLAIASLRSFDAYRKDQDQGDKSNFAIFSNGPYKLEGKWEEGKGGMFVRNDQWDSSTDDIREALPDQVKFTEGLENAVITDRLIADAGDDQFAVTDRSIPPETYTQITGAIADRAQEVDSPFVSYLLPNFNKMTNPKVRQALSVSTNVNGWIDTLGGDKAGVPAKSIVNPAVPGYQDNPAFVDNKDGDVAAAKKLLEESGEKLPYPIKFTYSSTPTADKGAAALKDTWDKAGFDVTLDPLTDTYYAVIQKPSADGDVFWGGWGADWPGIETVIPPLLDSRINFTENSNGQNYGNYKSDELNKLIDDAAAKSTPEEADAIYAEADKLLGEDVAYIPLEVTRFYLMRGSKVTGYLTGPATNGYPDLGSAGLQQ
jgi:peptide/nickel transport system substrate-binding protein